MGTADDKWGMGNILVNRNMTKQEAKLLSLDVWEYLRDHPEINRKKHLPIGLWNRIKDLENQCPLCTVVESCMQCPLGDAIGSSCFCTHHQNWSVADDENVRKEAANKIISLIQSWKWEIY
jgi:hypothetical protein